MPTVEQNVLAGVQDVIDDQRPNMSDAAYLRACNALMSLYHMAKHVRLGRVAATTNWVLAIEHRWIASLGAYVAYTKALAFLFLCSYVPLSHIVKDHINHIVGHCAGAIIFVHVAIVPFFVHTVRVITAYSAMYLIQYGVYLSLAWFFVVHALPLLALYAVLVSLSASTFRDGFFEHFTVTSMEWTLDKLLKAGSANPASFDNVTMYPMQQGVCVCG